MFRFVKQILVSAMIIFGCNASNINSLKYASISNQKCKIRPEITNITVMNLYFILKMLKNVVTVVIISVIDMQNHVLLMCLKIVSVKVFNLMSRTNEARHIKWHKTCKCKCRLDASVCNNKQHWNNNKCRRECKESIDKGMCDEGFTWNPSNCERECNKL